MVKTVVQNISHVRVGSDGGDPNGGIPALVKFAKISVTNGNNVTSELVAAVTGKKIRVLSVWLQGGGTGPDIVFESGSTDLTGAIEISATAGAPCGSFVERWQSGSVCHYRLYGCSASDDLITASASTQ